MGQRSKADLELARLISDRVALVLADRPPRRARDPDELVDGLPDSLPSVLPYEPPGGHSGELPDDRSDQSPDESSDQNPDKSPDKLRAELPRQRFSRMHVGVVSTLLVLGLITAGWLLLRARPVAVASPGDVVTVDTPGDMVNTFAVAAKAPQIAVPLDRRVTGVLPTSVLPRALRPGGLVQNVLRTAPAQLVLRETIGRLGIPPEVLEHVSFPTAYASRRTERALSGSGLRRLKTELKLPGRGLGSLRVSGRFAR